MSTHATVRPRYHAAMSTTLCLALILSLLTAVPTPAAGVTDEHPSFEIIASDLEFILAQIKISESHAAGNPLLCASTQDTSGTCVPSPFLPWGLRTVDGSYNNLLPGRTHFGAADNIFPRLLDIDLRPGVGEAAPVGSPPQPPGATDVCTGAFDTPTCYQQTSGFVYDSHPRVISNLIVDQTTNNPAAVAVANKVDGSVIDNEVPVSVAVELNEDDTALAYDPAPFPVVSSPEAMAQRTEGSAVYMEGAGAQVSFTFTDGFRWIGNMSLGRGIAEVYIDDVLVATVDQYNPTDLPGIEHFAVSDQGSTDKVARIVNTGERHPDSVAARTEIDAIILESLEGEQGSGRIFIPNESPDEGLSAPFNTFMTFFGQFFDHGLDLVNKGGNGTVVVPLKPDDPLYVEGGSTNFLQLTRATLIGDPSERNNNNQTTPFVDQNQTYTSHPSHQVFLREYTTDGRATGHLLDGADGGLANWREVKEQALTVLGIQLTDHDVVNVPLLRTDPYGNFVPGPNGHAQYATPTGFVEADGGPVPDDALRTNHAFLDDIAHAAAPFSSRGIRLEPGSNPEADPLAVYDDALLDAHFITGDGRGNENIGLTAVHHVFHAEHNRVADHIEDVLGDNPALKERYESEGDNRWDYGQRLFQAARYVTEMEYQHLVFEEFGRTLAPFIDEAPLNESTYHLDLDAAITAEFAHVVYRFGHSMLTETVERDGFGATDLSLLDAFLNPHEFTMGGALTPEQAAGALVNGMVASPGSGIDEFVTETLRNELLGLPLDLATINLMRGRDTGVPPLQEARRRFFATTGDTDLAPYTSWEDFGEAMRNPESLVNFVAAYGTHATITGADTVESKRAAAQVLVDNDDAFLRGPAASSGLDTVDFWMGGLAEANVPFAGFLGTTFNYVFETQMENLQNGDRFYYLSRNIGLNLFHQLEANSFSALIMRTTDATNIPAEVFTTPDHTFDLTLQDDEDVVAGWAEAGFTRNDDPNPLWRYRGEDHINVHGTSGMDRIQSGIGDDSLWGSDGDDHIRGGAGADSIVGGHGNDILYGEGDDDNIKGGPGNDAIHGGSGEDLLLGGSGQDLIMHGSDITQSFGGTGNDFIRGGAAHDIIAGNEGDDWLEGGAGADLVQGDNSNGFQDDPNGGHDVLWGGPGNDDLDAEGGDDIMIGSLGSDRYEGMLGFDWVTHRGVSQGAVADMDNTAFQPPSVGNFRSRYDLVEGISGWDHDDVLRGVGANDENDGSGHELTDEHLDRVSGLRDLLGGGDNPPYAAPFMTANTLNNIMLGGGGSDIIEGRGGDDFIDGSAWLNVQLEAPAVSGGGVVRYDSITELQARVFAGELDPGDITIVREILTVDEPDVINTAVFSDDLASYDITENTDGTLQVAHARGLGGPAGDELPGEFAGDGTDVLRNIQRLQFADQVLDLTGTNSAAEGQPVITDLPAVQGSELGVDLAGVTDADGIDTTTLSYEWQVESIDDEDVATWAAVAGDASQPTFTPGADEVGLRVRIVVTFLDNMGVLEEVTSDPTDPVLGDGAPVPTAELSRNGIDFGQQTVGSSSAPQSVTVTNVGNDDSTLAISTVEVTGDDAGAFTITGGDCPTDLAAGGTCTVEVSFTPTAAQGFSADLSITHNAAGSPALVELTGEGTAVAVTPPTVTLLGGTNFGNRRSGQPQDRTIRVQNDGPGVLTIDQIEVVGSEAFTLLGDTCPASLAVRGRCDVQVRFDPPTPGPHEADLVVTSDASNSPTSASLTGNGR